MSNLIRSALISSRPTPSQRFTHRGSGLTSSESEQDPIATGFSSRRKIRPPVSSDSGKDKNQPTSTEIHDLLQDFIDNPTDSRFSNHPVLINVLESLISKHLRDVFASGVVRDYVSRNKATLSRLDMGSNMDVVFEIVEEVLSSSKLRHSVWKAVEMNCKENVVRLLFIFYFFHT
jgi:hypothetical protein